MRLLVKLGQNVIDRHLIMSRRQKMITLIAFDALFLFLSYIVATILVSESFDFGARPAVWFALISSVMVTVLSFWKFGFYQVVLRFITGKVLVIVAKGVLVGVIFLYATKILLNADFSPSVPIIFALFAFLMIGGIRFAVRTHYRKSSRLSKRPVIIYGAGEAGLQLMNALYHGNEFLPMALIDDDRSLQNLEIGGVPVYSFDRIPQLAQETGAKVILLAIPSVDHLRRREIVNGLVDLNLEIKTIPKMSDLISGKAKISELRRVSAEDLLGRDPVYPEPELLGKNVTGRVVMVSGAGGSIGSELCRQIVACNPSVLLLYEISEFALYSIEVELLAKVTSTRQQTKVVPILGSIQNLQRLEATIKAFKVQTIYHAAAYKHVPLVEENIVEGIQNNVAGTVAITNAAQKFGVENFILISTDKAVRPTNVMGATKRIAELICQAHTRESCSTIFSIVRFGNVLESSGSVIPRFRAQIEAGGPVTVTHRDIKRYFMTIQEAAQLVIQAGAMGKGGDVFVLDMGEPVKIIDLAFSMVNLYGLTPYLVENQDQFFREKGYIPVCFTGLRKGEKLYEELLVGKNSAPTQHPRIMTATEISMPRNQLNLLIERLLQACEVLDLPLIISILQELPLDYVPLNTDITDRIWSAEQDIQGCQNITNTHGDRG